jgi:putative ABC transport system permease protein
MSVFSSQNAVIAARSLWQHKRRTFLLGGAIAGVTTLLVLMLGIFDGIQKTIVESATTVMTGHVNVGGFYKVTAGQSAPVVTHYSRVMEVLNKEIDGIDFAVMRGRGWAKVVSETGSMQLGLTGIDVKTERRLKEVVQIEKGSLEDLEKPHTIMIFAEQAKKLGAEVGDELTLSAPTFRGMNNTLDVTVVAIARDIGFLSSWSSFLPNSAIRELYQLNDDAAGAIQIYLKDMKQVPRVSEQVRTVLAAAGFELLDKDPRAFWFKFENVNREGWTGQKLDITTWEDEISFIKTTVTALSVLGNVLIFILLIVISVGIMNTLWIAIRERTREIGTLRAIGMQKRSVIGMFITEAFLLSVASTAAGVTIGIILCAIINAQNVHVPESIQLFLMRDQLHLHLVASSIVAGMLLIVSCTTLIALIPSFLAARLKPVTAMSSVG